MLTECATKARARRVSALETIESRRINSGVSQGGLHRHSGATSPVFQSSRTQPVYAPVF